MKGFVATTDYGWYEFLLARPQLREVNFWQPGSRDFSALSPGEPFFFKLKAPHNAIGGFGYFDRYARIPISRAWQLFGEANGARSEKQLLWRLRNAGRNTEQPPDGLNRLIGCIIIRDPTFLKPGSWVSTPADWKRNIVSGRIYDLSRGEGQRLWRAALDQPLCRHR